MEWKNMNDQQPDEQQRVLVHYDGKFCMARYIPEMGRWNYDNKELGMTDDVHIAVDWCLPEKE